MNTMQLRRIILSCKSLPYFLRPVTHNLHSAKMDATENDLPASVPFSVTSFPTLKFKLAGSDEWLDYDGDRTLESLIAFVDEHAKIPTKAAAGNESAPSQPAVEFHDQTHDEL